jgi:hypothetical protein
VHTATGNTIGIKDLLGGGFNPLSPNDPTDTDLAQYVKPLIQQYLAKHQQKG